MEITREWQEITLSATNFTTVQNITGSMILLKLEDALPTDDDNAVYVDYFRAGAESGDWTYVHDTRKFYVRGSSIPEGDTAIITVV